MPRGDRTGPQGEGPMTGRQLGYGAGYDSPGYTKSSGAGLRRGFWGRTGRLGRGSGFAFFRRGRGRDYNSGYFRREEALPPQGETEMRRVQTEVSDLKERLNMLIERIESLSSPKRRNDKNSDCLR